MTAVEPTETDNKWAQLRKLIEDGDRAEALALAKEMQAEKKAKERADRKSQALGFIDQANPGELDLDGIVGTLDIEAGDKYAGVFKPVSEIKPFLPKPNFRGCGCGRCGFD